MTLAIALDLEADDWLAVPDVATLPARVLAVAAARCGEVLADGAEASVLLCDDDAIRALNRDWRGVDRPTNVLSFPGAGPLATRPLLGDIAVAWGTTQREAAAEGKAVADHLAHLLVHGFLHLVGRDHGEDAEAEDMEALEIRILAELGIADPYRATEPVGDGAR